MFTCMTGSIWSRAPHFLYCHHPALHCRASPDSSAPSNKQKQHAGSRCPQLNRINPVQLPQCRQQPSRQRHRWRTASSTAGSAAAMPEDVSRQTGSQKLLRFIQAQFLPLALLAAMIVGCAHTSFTDPSFACKGSLLGQLATQHGLQYYGY